MQIRTATTSARALKRSRPATACSCGGTRSSLDLEQPRCRCPPAPRATAFRGRGGATSPSEKPLELPPSSHRSSICTEPPLLLTAPGRRLLPRIVESTINLPHPPTSPTHRPGHQRFHFQQLPCRIGAKLLLCCSLLCQVSVLCHVCSCHSLEASASEIARTSVCCEWIRRTRTGSHFHPPFFFLHSDLTIRGFSST